ERTKVLIHIVDAASVEGRDPIADIEAINKELESYNVDLSSRPQVIAANKCDVMSPAECETVIEMLQCEYEPKGIKVFPISAVSGKGVKELLWYVNDLVKQAPEDIVEFEPEFDVEFMDNPELPFEVLKGEEEGVFLVEGPRIERMLGYTNLESEKGFAFFQRFLKENGILDKLEELGIEEGDTVKLYGLEFDYYK
ncbi:MAG: Obg family GTPase CgtA, partial [Wujia sp.]